MGLSVLGRSSDRKSTCECSYCPPPSPEKKLPNPDPENWQVIKTEQNGEYLAVMIRYPDCKNFEGKKIMVYRATMEQLSRQGAIDPHFGDDKKAIYPEARFKPTDQGWEDACLYATIKNWSLLKKRG